MDKSSQDIISKFSKFWQCNSIYCQWIPFHVGMNGKEMLDDLARKGSVAPASNSTDLFTSEIHSLYKYIMNSSWKLPPVHH